MASELVKHLSSLLTAVRQEADAERAWRLAVTKKLVSIYQMLERSDRCPMCPMDLLSEDTDHSAMEHDDTCPIVSWKAGVEGVIGDPYDYDPE